MSKPIPYGRQQITDQDIEAVVQTLQSDFLTQGPSIARFEEAFAAYIGSKYAVAVANGTAALHLAAMALDISPGDKVITTPISFSATSNCIRYCGGEVVFADIDPNTFLLDIQKVSEMLESSPAGTYKGIIPVDFGGLPVNLEAYRTLADKHNLWLLEDACHAPGAYFIDQSGNKQHCGNGQFADLAIFSFHPVKHIACGEGGMVTTNNKSHYERLMQLRTHGITKDSQQFTNPIDLATGVDGSSDYPGWYMELQELGYNYRLSDLHAALGLSQLDRAHEGLERRQQIARRYREAFAGHPVISCQLIPDNDISHGYHLFVIEVQDRLELFNYLRDQNILVQVHYVPIHLMPYYQAQGWRLGDLPVAEKFYQGCLSIPMFPALTDKDQDRVISSILAFYS